MAKIDYADGILKLRAIPTTIITSSLSLISLSIYIIMLIRNKKKHIKE